MIESRRPDPTLRVLFVSSSGKIFKLIPFIQSQYDSLKPFVGAIDHFRISGGIFAYFSAYKHLKQKLRSGNYDIIHAHWTYSGILCSLLKKKEKLFISFMGNDLHGYYFGRFNIVTLRGIINIILSQILIVRSNGIIVKSRRMSSWVPKYFRFKTRVIPNGVNLKKFGSIDQKYAREFLGIEPERKYIAFLADPNDKNKNYSLFLGACKVLDDSGIKYEKLVPYPVSADKIPYYLAAADVLAFPSKMEGSPNIVKEAIAMRCPIVSTDVGDVKERLEGIEGCYVVQSDEANFSRGLKAAISFNKRLNPGIRLEEIAENRIAAKLVDFYLWSLVDKRRRKEPFHVELYDKSVSRHVTSS